MRKEISGVLATMFSGLALVAHAQVPCVNFNIEQLSTSVFNDRIGNSRLFGGPNTDRVRVTTFVSPSPDSDAFSGSCNGALTSVSVTHNNFGTLTNPRILTFVGLTSLLGGFRNEWTTTFNRANPAIAPLLGAWSETPHRVTVMNPLAPSGTTSVTLNTVQYDQTAMPGFLTDLRVIGGGLNPRLEWTLPASPTPSAVNISIRRVHAESADGSRITQSTLVHSRNLAATATGYTINEPFSNRLLTGDDGLVVQAKYEITVSVDLIAAGVLKGRARTHFEFTPLPGSFGNVAVYLPSLGPNGAFKFDVTVNATDMILIDPLVAVGYIYEVGAGDPNFRSVSLPPNIGDGIYTVDVFDASLGQYRPGFAAVAGTTYDFVATGYPDGVSKFRVKGIEASAGLDATNTTAFVTAVGFMAAGRFTGTMVPISGYEVGNFLPPVNVAPSVNTTRAGSTLALKWAIVDKQGFRVSDLTAVSSVSYKPSSCASFTTDPSGTAPAHPAGGSNLRYDALAAHYIFNWKTPRLAGCYVVFVTLDTQQVLNANVMLTN